MKRRYNHETKQWDIVLREQDYYHLMRELEMLRCKISSQIKPAPSLLPSFRKCGNSTCRCSGVCLQKMFYQQTTNLSTFLGTGGN